MLLDPAHERALRLIKYLQALASLRTKIVRDIKDYENILWLHEIPDEKVRDALRCQTRIELAYGYDNELIATHYYVEKILEVLPDIHHQQTPLDFEKGAEPT